MPDPDPLNLKKLRERARALNAKVREAEKLAGGGTYDTHREAAADRAREKSRKGRDIGPIPAIADVDRRRACTRDLKLFCQTYNPEAFYLPWSDTQIAEVKRMEEAATLGALFAMADPRGDGKTVRCRMFTLWATSNAIAHYALMIGSNGQKAEEAIETLKTWIRFLPLFRADFPEIAVPFLALDGVAQRATGQLCNGQSTLIKWDAGRIIFPTVSPPPNWPKEWPLRSDGMVPTSGAVIGSSGLTGEGIRGSVITLTTGEMLRPDLVVCDDPQTDESAHSKTQNETRLHLISSAILGLAGPGEKIAVVMPCTVIARNDAADQLLDRTKNPLWRGTRHGILRSMPKNLKAWDDYFEIFDACALKEPPDFIEANEHYVEHREILDEGAIAAWEARKEPGDVSAIQHAMHLYHRDPAAFWSEYMNSPIDEDSILVSRKLDADVVKRRVNNIPRLVVPRESTRLVSFIDCGKDLLWYATLALDENFSGGFIDYGWWPEQTKTYFSKANPPISLGEKYRNLTEDQLLYSALTDLTAIVLGRSYIRHCSEEVLKVDRCLVDEGWLARVVYQFCRESPFASILLPSKGHFSDTGNTPMSKWKARDGERAAKLGQPSWRVGHVQSGRGRHAIFESNEWKSFAVDRLTTPPGGRGSIRLFGDEHTNHSMFADHCTSEYATTFRTEDGKRFDKWQMKATRDDNDLFDCMVGCLVAAGVQGLEWFADPNYTPCGAEREVKPIQFDEVMRRRQQQFKLEPPPQPTGPGLEPRKKIRFADVQRRREQQRRSQ